MIALLLTAAASLPQFAAPADSPHDYRDPKFYYFVAGDPTLPRATHTEFELVLMGGGGIVDAAYASIASHAGGGHIVILRAVSDEGFDPQDGRLGVWFVTKWGPVASAQTIVFRNREASFDPRVLAALRSADGIFLAGGDQANYVRYWKGTPVQQALDAHVRANRPLGGSSAGLAIMGHYSYTALDGGSLESKSALSDPCGPGVTLESDFLHFRWLEDMIADTHFSQRSRLGRLIVFIARIDGQRGDAAAYGIGVDENSALVVDAHGVGVLSAGSAGSAWLVMPQQPAAVLQARRPLSLSHVRILRVGPDSRLDLRTRSVLRPAAQTSVSIEAGRPARNPMTSPMMLREAVPPNES